VRERVSLLVLSHKKMKKEYEKMKFCAGVRKRFDSRGYADFFSDRLYIPGTVPYSLYT
jgi:hypothetical protein